MGEQRENVPNQNSFGSVSRRAVTERRKTKKKLFCVLCERRKGKCPKSNKFIRICLKESFHREK
jgi:hypothetical protein